jgi:hypothetical protein
MKAEQNSEGGVKAMLYLSVPGSPCMTSRKPGPAVPCIDLGVEILVRRHWTSSMLRTATRLRQRRDTYLGTHDQVEYPGYTKQYYSHSINTRAELTRIYRP